jgi:hypothetical protein
VATTVDQDRVQALIGTLPAEPYTFHAYAQAAIQIVDTRLVDVPDQTLKNMIADHLTAHYLELEGMSAGLVSKRIGDASWSWSADAVKNMAATRNGRIAIELDPTGSLAEGSKPVPTFVVLGA